MRGAVQFGQDSHSPEFLVMIVIGSSLMEHNIWLSALKSAVLEKED